MGSPIKVQHESAIDDRVLKQGFKRLGGLPDFEGSSAATMATSKRRADFSQLKAQLAFVDWNF